MEGCGGSLIVWIPKSAKSTWAGRTFDFLPEQIGQVTWLL